MRAATIRGLSRSPTAGVFSEANEAFTPRSLPNLAAWFDALDTRTMLSGDGSTITDGGAVALWGDKSGNSGTNCLVLPGVAANYASAPDENALDFSTRMAGAADFAFADWTPSAAQIVFAKRTAGQYAYIFYLNTNGTVSLSISTDGNATAATFTSDEAVSTTEYARKTFGFEANFDTGSGSSVIFYTSPDRGSTWVQLGTEQTSLSSFSIPARTSALEIGSQLAGTTGLASGVAYRVFLTATTLSAAKVLDIDFSTAGKKLANGDTFVCATGQTVTLNSSGATGARIAGERDYFMGTAGSRGTYNAAGKYIATDGTDDYYKTAAFPLPQPVTLYAVLEQTTWTSGDYLFDGSASDTLALIQTTTTPQINLSAGSSVAANTDLATATKALVTIVSNGSSSLVSINRLPATTGNAGAGVPNGLTLASKGTAGSYGNARYYEIAVYRAAHDQATRHRFALYAARKWGFAA